MDRELIAFLKTQFDAVNTRFDGIDARLDGMDARFDGNDAKFESIDRRFDEVQEQNRHTHVLIEDLKSKVQLLAEGHAAQDEKIDRRFDEAETGRQEDRGHLEARMKATFLHLSRRDDELEKRTELALRAASGLHGP